MNQAWKNYLSDNGAVFEDQVIVGFSDSSNLPKGEVLAGLTNLGVLRVRGENSLTFLQSHFCNDVALLEEGQGQLSGYCNPKGRLLAIFYLLRNDNDYLLVMPLELLPSVSKRLSMFAQMARPVSKQLVGNFSKSAIEIQDVSSEIAVLGSVGAVNLERAESAAMAVMPLSKMDDGQQRFLAVLDNAAAQELWSVLSSAANPVTDEQWRLLDIQAGLPTVLTDTLESFVPQMVNLHLLNGVSFSKGCYPGQEIVARMQYLGKIKRRMYRFSVESSDVSAGSVLATASDAAAGTVVQSAKVNQSGSSELLAVVKEGALDSTLQLGDMNGPTLKQLALPYSFEVETA